MIRFFGHTSDSYKDSAVNLSLTEAIYFPSMNFFIGLSMLSTVAVGGYLSIRGVATAGNIAEFVIYINLLMFPISSIGWVASMVQRAGASQKRINEFLHTQPEIVSKQSDSDFAVSGNILFRDVSFTYQHTGIQALKSFTLEIRAGEKIAVIGRTGSGKSTIAHLLLRMYDPQDGRILIEGKDLKGLSVSDLRKQIAYAPQDNYLFSDTIYNNIGFGKDDATDDEVKEAARLAALDQDIALLPKGFDTVVGERGVMLSGGQKQRIVLARALLKKSKLLLLDECLSAVDTRTEKTIIANLQEYLQDKTLIIITHRLFTGLHLDRIVVMNEGQIEEQGTHEELMDLGGEYFKLYKHQMAVTER
jgi:ATP-binding cassette subfamily B protein